MRLLITPLPLIITLLRVERGGVVQGMSVPGSGTLIQDRALVVDGGEHGSHHRENGRASAMARARFIPALSWRRLHLMRSFRV
jgi:hypothetical protein